MATDAGHHSYPTTIWAEIERAQDPDSEAACQALEGMLAKYYPPLQRQLVRDFQVSEDQAADWLQSFLWKKVLLRNLFASAARKRGKFRTFLITALQNFVRDELEHRARQRRAPSGGMVPLEKIGEAASIATRQEAGRSLDRAWGRALLENALAEMRSECEGKGKRQKQVWEVFRLRLLEPEMDGVKPPPYKELFDRLGFKDDAEAGNALITAKRMFRRFLRSEVAKWERKVSKWERTEEEIDEEIRELITIFAAE
jgi:RNA polymerase sigma-70 factor (ECF subfamily)